MNARASASSERRAQQKIAADELFTLSRLPPEPACHKLEADAIGLTSDEAAQRLKTYGLNLVTREKQPTIVEEIWNRSKIPLNALLVTLAVVSYFLGDVRAAVVIAVMVFLSVITAFIQEHRSNERQHGCGQW